MFIVRLPLLVKYPLLDKDKFEDGKFDLEQYESSSNYEFEGNQCTLIITKSGNEYISQMNEKEFDIWLNKSLAEYNASPLLDN